MCTDTEIQPENKISLVQCFLTLKELFGEILWHVLSKEVMALVAVTMP